MLRTVLIFLMILIGTAIGVYHGIHGLTIHINQPLEKGFSILGEVSRE